MKLADTLVFIQRRVQWGAPDECWPWIGYVGPQGYGVAARGGGLGAHRAHRYVWTHLVGPIPEGMVLDHLCHNRSDCNLGVKCPHRRCVNPAHLEVVPVGVNSLRGRTAGAVNMQKKTCPEGHPYDYVDAHGWRQCTTCGVRRNRERRRRLREAS